MNLNFSVSSFFLLHQDITDSLYVLATVVWMISPVSHIATHIAVIGVSSCTKPYSRVTETAIRIIVTKNTDSYFSCGKTSRESVESFLVAVRLQGAPRTNQCLPRITTQWGIAVLPISNQGMQRVRLPVDDSKAYFLADVHTQTDFREGCVPVGRQFGLFCVKLSLPSVNVKGLFVCPELWIVVKCSLK